MFTGLIQEVGHVERNQGRRLRIRARRPKGRSGDSVAVNGVCLTLVVSRRTDNGVRIDFDLSEETLARTTLGRLKAGTPVNLESALTLKDSLGGHLVQGHVDGVGRVASVKRIAGGVEMGFQAPKEIAPYLVGKGSIAVDGVSLTVARLRRDRFSVALIPHTLSLTNLDSLQPGDSVNMEADVIAKYVRKYIKR